MATAAEYDRQVRVREARRSAYAVVAPDGRIVRSSIQFFVGSDHDLSGWRTEEGRLRWTWRQFALWLLDVDFTDEAAIDAELDRAAEQGYRAQRVYLSTAPTPADPAGAP